MIRTLTLLFFALLGTVIWFRYSAPEAAKPADNAAPQSPLPEAYVQPGADAFPLLPARSLSNGLPEDGEWRGKPVLRDLNGDDHLDLAVSIRRYDKSRIADGIRVYVGDGAGSWTAADRGLPDDMGYGGTDSGDFNGDGRPDLFYSGHDLPPRVFLNFLGQENANEWVALESVMDLARISCSDVALGDFNGDGFADAAVMGFFPKTGGFYVLTNDGGAGFLPKKQLLKQTHYGAIVRFHDLDGDGNLELIGATSLGPKVWRHEDGEWIDDSEGLPTTFGLGEISGITRGIDARDLDGDGKAELVHCGLPTEKHASIRLSRREGDRWASWGDDLPIVESCFDVVFARLPGGHNGMFLAGQHGVLVVRLFEDGRNTVLGRIDATGAVLNVGAGDADGDGDDEVLALGQRGLKMFDFDLPEAKEGNLR